MKGIQILLLLTFPLGGLLAQAQPKTSSKPAQKPVPKRTTKPAQLEQLQKILAKDGVYLDMKKKEVRVNGTIRIVDDFLEYVLTGPRGKTHETLVIVPSKGSSINAALLALGLKPGSNCKSVPIVPKPTEKEFREGAPMNRLIPPKGAPNKGSQVWLSLSWKDAKGQRHTYRIEDLILDLQAGGPIKDVEWIYLGGRMAPLHRNEPPVFITDYAQNFVSAYYVFIPNHLITIHHKRAANDQNWWPNRTLLPERGTKVQIIFSLKPLVPRVAWKPTSYKDGADKNTKEKKASQGPASQKSKGK